MKGTFSLHYEKSNERDDKKVSKSKLSMYVYMYVWLSIMM